MLRQGYKTTSLSLHHWALSRVGPPAISVLSSYRMYRFNSSVLSPPILTLNGRLPNALWLPLAQRLRPTSKNFRSIDG